MMINMRALTVVLVLVPLLAGCAAKLLSDDRLGANTGGVLGVSPSEIAITNRVEQFPNTYYTATTKGGDQYACSIIGGNVLSYGMVGAPTCTRKPAATSPAAQKK